MNQDTIVKFIKSEVSRYDDEIRYNAQARLLTQHRLLVSSAGVSWLTDVTPEYNRSEASLIKERWQYCPEGESVPELLPVDEELDIRVKEASEILTRLGEAAEIDFDYVESLLRPLTAQSEFRYWIARAVAQSPGVVEEAPGPAALAPSPAHGVTARPVVPAKPSFVPISRVAAISSRPVMAVAPVEPVAVVAESIDELVEDVEVMEDIDLAESDVVVTPDSRAAIPITTRIATASRPEVEEHVFVAESAE